MSDYALRLSEAEVDRYRHMAETAARTESAQWTAAGIVDGAAVADVGCGPGEMSVVLAQIVGPTGRVYAVDREPEALALAAEAAQRAGLDTIDVRQGEATATGLEPGSVDAVMMRHVLAHNGGREQAIVDHLASLVRPGGTVFLMDIEVSAMRVLPAETAGPVIEMFERYADFHAGLGNDLSVGLRLGELLEAAGLAEVDHQGHYVIMKPRPGMRPPVWAAREQMLAAGAATEDDIARWAAVFDRLDRGELTFTMFMAGFSAFGRKPV